MGVRDVKALVVLRIGDRERDECIARLREAYAGGEISAEQFGRRSHAALRARSELQLRRLAWDLREREPEPEPPRHDCSTVALRQWRDTEGRRLEVRYTVRGMLKLLAMQATVCGVAAGILVSGWFLWLILAALLIVLILAETELTP